VKAKYTRSKYNRQDVPIVRCSSCGATYWDSPHPNGSRWQHCEHLPDCSYGSVSKRKVGAGGRTSHG